MPELSDANLDLMLVALQEGDVEYGDADCEFIGNMICEIKALRRRVAALDTPMRYKGAEIIWDPVPYAKWRQRVNMDVTDLVAPDGSVLYTMSGLEELKHTSRKELDAAKAYIEMVEMERWRANKGVR